MAMEIKLATLREGLNEVHFETTAAALGFAETSEEWLIFPDKIITDVVIQKLSDKYFIKGKIFARARFVCDRCLEFFDQPLTSTLQLCFLGDAEDNNNDDDNIRLLPKKATTINLAGDVVENLLLAIPMKKICQEDCLGLCSHCGVNLNQKKCHCHEEKVDPRWEKLKNLK